MVATARFWTEQIPSTKQETRRPLTLIGCNNITGCGIPTLGQFRLYDGGKYDITAINGDNRVPVTSAVNLAGSFFRNYFAAAYDHAGLIRDPEPIALINNILEDRPDDMPQGISPSSAECFTSPITSEQVLFSSHSPVTLRVFDSQNRHVGPLENGDMELAIPGSQYFTIEGNSFAYVPAGDTYRVELQATAAGTFDFKVETLRNLETENKVTYLTVPLASSQTKAELAFATAQGGLTLKLDNEGDGVFDASLQPNAVLAAEEATDITPPTIAVRTIPSEITLNTPFIFEFSAADDLSGVAVLTATLNGDPVNESETVTLSKAGRNVLEITAIDRAGNPSVRQIVFRVVYDFSGFFPPLHKTPLILQTGRGAAVKFELKDAAGASVSNAQALLFLAPLTNGEPGEFRPAAPEGSSNTANQFRFDEKDKQYVYNWGTRGLAAGLYRLKTELDDGESYFVDVELRSGGQQRTFFNLLWASLSETLRPLVEMLKKL